MKKVLWLLITFFTVGIIIVVIRMLNRKMNIR